MSQMSANKKPTGRLPGLSSLGPPSAGEQHTLQVINRERPGRSSSGADVLRGTICLLPALRNLALYDVYLRPKQQLVVGLASCSNSLLKCFKVNRKKEESDPPAAAAAVLPQVSLPTLEPRLISELLFKLKLK
ncbi:hypothetical protein TYRP_022257 [Tyrophagus putrescentiae]|nr:hypothetical protein TYRP_022257 [Tyrophagus putrescentiae]